MAITPSIVLPSPAIITTGVPTQIGLTIANTEASAITIAGIEMYDKNGIFVVGDFAPALPVRYDTYTAGNTSAPFPVGTPVLAQVPSWGTADQSTKTALVSYPAGAAPTQSNLTYPVSSLTGYTWSITTTSGSYSGGSASSTGTPNWVTIPAGATATLSVGAISQLLSAESGSALANFMVGNIQARIQISGTAAPIDTTGTNSLYLVGKTIKNIEVSPISIRGVVPSNTWGRPPAFYPPLWAGGSANGFDAALQTNLVFIDDTTLDISNWDIRNNYSSTAAGTIAVVANGSYGSTTPNTAITSSNGAIVGGQNTQLLKGAGALTFTFPNTNTFAVSNATLSNAIGAGLTGSCVVGLTDRVAIGLYVFPPLAQSRYVSGTPNQVVPSAQWIVNDGTLAATTGATLLWTASDSDYVINSSTGVGYWNAARNASVVITCKATYQGTTQVGSAVVSCVY